MEDISPPLPVGGEDRTRSGDHSNDAKEGIQPNQTKPPVEAGWSEAEHEAEQHDDIVGPELPDEGTTTPVGQVEEMQPDTPAVRQAALDERQQREQERIGRADRHSHRHRTQKIVDPAHAESYSK